MRGYPVKELDTLQDGELFATGDKMLTPEENEIAFHTDERIADIHITVRPAAGAKTVSLSFSDGEVMHKLQGEEKVSLRVLIDRPMYEIFVNRGETYALKTRSGKPLGRISLQAEGVVEEFRAFRMKSIWGKD